MFKTGIITNYIAYNKLLNMITISLIQKIIIHKFIECILKLPPIINKFDYKSIHFKSPPIVF